jgi:predicted RND superfamily exporter protein
MKLPMAVKFVATLAQLGMAAWLGTSEHFYKSTLLSIFFGVTLASVVMIHFHRVVKFSEKPSLVKRGHSGATLAVSFPEELFPTVFPAIRGEVYSA